MWHVREMAEQGDTSRETMEAAVALLLESVPRRARGAATAELNEALREIHQRHLGRVPAWIDAPDQAAEARADEEASG